MKPQTRANPVLPLAIARVRDRAGNSVPGTQGLELSCLDFLLCVSATQRSSGHWHFSLGVPSMSLRVSPSGPCPWSSFLPHHRATCCCEALLIQYHFPRHSPLFLLTQPCPQQDAAACLPDNCQPEVWTPSPWWLPLFH